MFKEVNLEREKVDCWLLGVKRRGKWRTTANEYGIQVRVMKLLKLVVMVAQLCEYAKTH